MMKGICAKFVHVHKKRERRRRKQRWRDSINEELIYTSQQPDSFGSDRFALTFFIIHSIFTFILSAKYLIEKITKYDYLGRCK